LSDPAVALVAFAVTAALTPLCIVVARRTGIVDEPGALKAQTASVPYLGGVAVLAGLVVGAMVLHPRLLLPLVAASALGVADDRFDLPVSLRAVGELAVGVLVWVTAPAHLHAHVPTAVAAVGVVAITVMLINGVNLIDGLDMLAAGVVAVGAAGFAAIGVGRPLALSLAAALLAFLLFNRPPARIYLGDGGAYLLGTALTVLLVASFAPGVPDATGIAALALVSVPAAEVLVTVVRRLRSRRSLFAGDRGHPYDRLVARGWPRPAASLAYIGAAALVAAGAVAAGRNDSLAGAVAVDLASAALLLGAAAMTGAFTSDKDALA
jgi:UDP-GlcNAc:undecaprenyl-phosphate GlcNAc-1-phosphate transferase